MNYIRYILDLIYLNVAQAQESTTVTTPDEVDIDECILSDPGFFFCTPDVELDKAVQAQKTKGYCCNESGLGDYS